MKDSNVKKQPAKIRVEIKYKEHTFIVGEKRQTMTRDIYGKLA